MSVTAHSTGATASGRGLIAAVQRSISRNEFFAGLYILGCVNGLMGRILLAMNSAEDWTGILGVDISFIVLFALYGGISTLLGAEKEELRSADLAVGAIAFICFILPVFALSWVAITVVSLYVLL